MKEQPVYTNKSDKVIEEGEYKGYSEWGKELAEFRKKYPNGPFYDPYGRNLRPIHSEYIEYIRDSVAYLKHLDIESLVLEQVEKIATMSAELSKATKDHFFTSLRQAALFSRALTTNENEQERQDAIYRLRVQIPAMILRAEWYLNRKEGFAYDAIIVLGGGLTLDGHEAKEFENPESIHLRGDERFVSTGLSDSDPAGPLGGVTRPKAAALVANLAPNIIFSTGISDPSRKKFTPLLGRKGLPTEIPSEAKIYSEEFLDAINDLNKRGLRDSASPLPNIIYEDKSKNTGENIREVLTIAKEKGWKKLCILTSNYHGPRALALYQETVRLNSDTFSGLEVSFIPAEACLMAFDNGVDNYELEQYYNSPEMDKRQTSEKKGLADLVAGKYNLPRFD